MSMDVRNILPQTLDFKGSNAVNKGADWARTIVIAPAIAPILKSTNASPIQITTQIPHGLSTGNTVVISGHGVNTAANNNTVNQTWTVTVIDTLNFTLNGSAGNGVGGATGNVGQPLNLTGYTPAMNICDAPGGYIIITPSVSVISPATNGMLQIVMTAAQTAAPVVPNTNTQMANDPVDMTTRAVSSGIYDLWIKGTYTVKLLQGVVQFVNTITSPQ